MGLAISAEHRALADTAAEVLRARDSRGAARALLESDDEPLPALWHDVVDLGWLALHVPEVLGGSGFGAEELVIVAEALGTALAPGPFVPTVIASSVLVESGGELATRLVPGLVGGTRTAGIAFGADLEMRDGRVFGSGGAVLGGGQASVVLAAAGDDVVVVDVGDHATVDVPANLDPTRRSARITFDGAAADVITGARDLLTDATRLLLAAEAAGIARACTDEAAAYAKIRQQFGRPIATFQAVKHHCANMLVATELATAAVWDAARAASAASGEADDTQRSYSAAVAACLAGPAAVLCANLDIQVHGGIGFTWEHDAHLLLRRATVLCGYLDPDVAAADLTDMARTGATRTRAIDLPPEAEPFRDEVRGFAARIAGDDTAAQRAALVSEGYVMPHWPRPWGRAAGALEQLVIEEELAAAGIDRPSYGITGWIILTLIQYGTDEQVARWIPPALAQDVIWCQLFSEPDAGSDAAGITTRATRVDGGWLVTGQKVWTSGAHHASYGFATVRTNPDVAKHDGITTLVIDMHAEGVEVRPLRMTTGRADFNEVFLTEVFVPDDDVVGPVDGGWTVARATLGNESVSIGGGESPLSMPGSMLFGPFDAHPDRLPGGAARIGRYLATHDAMSLLHIRSAQRAMAGDAPGPEGNVTKLVLSEQGHEAAAILSALSGPDNAFLDGPGNLSGSIVLLHRALSIAGGTSEIKRNQIAERMLGLPRDPLVD